MVRIEEYISKTQVERQSHLVLSEPCVERGGGGGSYILRGLLAHYLDTTIPKGGKILLCHACHNKACSNPNHLYWGTASENCFDALKAGVKTAWDKTVEKHGVEGAREIQRSKRNGKSFNGRTNDSDSFNVGSNPAFPANSGAI